MILTSIKYGFFQLWKNNKRILIIFYLSNLFFALILMLPFRAAVSRFIGNSLIGAKLGGRMDMDFLFEFFKYNNTMPNMIFALLLIVPISYWLFNLFLSGGAFAVFASDEKYRAVLFWGSAGKYFGRFIRLVLWCMPVFIILLCLQFLWTAIEKIIFGSDPYQYITYWGGWIQVGLRYISIMLCWLVFDYARIFTVLVDEHRMRYSLLEGIKFAFGNFIKTFSLTIVIFAVGILALIIYNMIADLLSAANAIVIVALLFVQQIYIFFRMMLRLILYLSQMHLYKTLSTRQESAAFTSSDDIEAVGAIA